MTVKTVQPDGSIEYRTVDKTTWGPGTWQDEPDKVQWTDPATGMACLAKRQPSLGHWCGYVGVPPGHPYHGAGCDDPDVAVHGGVTYASGCQHGEESTNVCHVPDPGKPDDLWWIGFDCAHGFDLPPGFASRNGGSDYETYRDLSYVKSEIARLAQQLSPKGEMTNDQAGDDEPTPVRDHAGNRDCAALVQFD